MQNHLSLSQIASYCPTCTRRWSRLLPRCWHGVFGIDQWEVTELFCSQLLFLLFVFTVQRVARRVAGPACGWSGSSASKVSWKCGRRALAGLHPRPRPRPRAIWARVRPAPLRVRSGCVCCEYPVNSRKCQNGGSGGRARGCELLDGHGEEQVHSGRKSEQEDNSSRSEVS